jgi:peptide/nickel transport system substrate-binding protein
MKEKRFLRLIKQWHELEYGTRILFQSLTKKQKNLIITLITIMVILGLVLIAKARNILFVSRPIPGGTWTEGIVGSPRFINPVLAVSNVDRDLTSIVHSGLVKRMPDGTYAGDLADSYEIDKSALNYTFVIKDDAEFHDGSKVTADDVVYTIDRIKDPIEKSPRSIEWQGVTVRAVDEKTVLFTLKQPFNDFLDIATVGIIPKSVYGKYSADAFTQAKENIEAIGAGPYKIKSVTTKKNMPKSITLVKAYSGRDTGYISKIVFNFYDSEQEAISALNSGEIDHLGSVTAKEAGELKKKGYDVSLASFPRLYGVFFNTKKSGILMQPRVTDIIASSINKKNIIDSVLNGFGNTVDSPIPNNISQRVSMPYKEIDVEKTLKSQGWELGEDSIWEKTISTIKPGSKKAEKSTEKLAFVITTSDTPELRMGAEEIAKELKNHGILASVASFDSTTLEEKIRTRDYEALYYGIQISRESQVYAFWHSSQREHPGLNISGYTNAKADAALEELQKETDEDTRISLWRKFISAFYTDMPAVFIYSPSYVYIHKEKPVFDIVGNIHSASDRFINIKDWYLETEKVLPFLYKNK